MENLEKEYFSLAEQINRLTTDITFEKHPRKKQELITRKHALDLQLSNLRQKRDQQQNQEDGQITEQMLKERFSDIRVCTNSSQIANYQNGLLTMDVLPWEKLQSLKVKVKCNSGKEKDFDLAKLPPTRIRQLMEKCYTPTIITIENANMIDGKGNPVGLWSNQADYDVVSKQRHVFPTLIALMLV